MREGPGVVEKEIVQCHGAHSYKRPPAVPQAQKIREQLDDEDVQPRPISDTMQYLISEAQ